MQRLLALFLVTRALVFAAGFVGFEVLPAGRAVTGNNLQFERHAPSPLDIWARWDSEWYLLIAAEGYDVGETFAGSVLHYSPADATGFFPLYPMLIRSLAPAIGKVAAGVVISNLALAGSLLLMLALARDLWGERFGSRAGVAAGAALLVGPFTIFHSAVYAESLFLLLALATVLLARKDLFLAAGSVAGLAALSRPFGLLLAVPLVIEWWQSRHRSRWGWLSVAGVGAGLGLYMLFCFGLFGDALVFIDRQNRWRGGMGIPGWAFVRWWRVGPTLHGAHGSTVELVVAVVFLAVLPTAFRRLRPSLSFFLAAGVLLPLTSTLWSFGRVTSTLFPFYLLLGLVWAEGCRRWPTVWVAVGIPLALVAAALFAAGWWVG